MNIQKHTISTDGNEVEW